MILSPAIGQVFEFQILCRFFDAPSGSRFDPGQAQVQRGEGSEGEPICHEGDKE